MIIIILSFVGTGRRGMNQPWKVQLCSPSPSLVQSSWAWSWTRLVPIVGGGKRTSVATQWCTTPPAASFPIISFSTLRIENFTHVLARTEGGFFLSHPPLLRIKQGLNEGGLDTKSLLSPCMLWNEAGIGEKKIPLQTLQVCVRSLYLSLWKMRCWGSWLAVRCGTEWKA